MLQFFQIDGNKITGTIPENIGECRALAEFLVLDNMLSGQVPVASMLRCATLWNVVLGSHQPGGKLITNLTEFMRSYKEGNGTLYNGQGNKDLTITAEGKALLKERIVAHTNTDIDDGQYFPAVVG